VVQPVGLLHVLLVEVPGGHEERHTGERHHPNQLRHHRHVHQLKHLDDQVDLLEIAEQQGAHQLVGLQQELAQDAEDDRDQTHIEEQHGESHAVEQRPDP
jgi:hypothetical protein